MRSRSRLTAGQTRFHVNLLDPGALFLKIRCHRRQDGSQRRMARGRIGGQRRRNLSRNAFRPHLYPSQRWVGDADRYLMRRGMEQHSALPDGCTVQRSKSIGRRSPSGRQSGTRDPWILGGAGMTGDGKNAGSAMDACAWVRGISMRSPRS